MLHIYLHTQLRVIILLLILTLLVSLYSVIINICNFRFSFPVSVCNYKFIISIVLSYFAYTSSHCLRYLLIRIYSFVLSNFSIYVFFFLRFLIYADIIKGIICVSMIFYYSYCTLLS